MCSCLAPERIPRELLETAVEHSEARDGGPRAADDAIELLLTYALLTPAAGYMATLRVVRIEARCHPRSNLSALQSTLSVIGAAGWHGATLMSDGNPYDAAHGSRYEELPDRPIIDTNYIRLVVSP